VFEEKVLWRTFGPKREGVAGCWRRLHNDDLRNLYTSPNIIKAFKSRRVIESVRVEQMREIRIHTIFWLEKPEGRIQLGRPRGRWEDSIKTDLREIRWKMWGGFISLRIGTSGGQF
jgi:hypothetical protein